MAVDDTRAWLAKQVRGRIVGTDEAASKRRHELFESDGPRWFDDGSPIQRVHADASMFIGGLRALLFQSMHPLAMAGVAEHSDYRHNPWGRLQRTADFIAATTFGPIDQAERAVARVRSVHKHVRGVADDGRAYSANDPRLLRWVHLAEVDSFLAAHRRYGDRPLDDANTDEYIAQMAVIARALGVAAPPESRRALRDQLRSFRNELRGTDDARSAARYLLLQPPMHPLARPTYGVLAAAAVALMPMSTRWPLRLPLLPAVEALAVRPAAQAITAGLRWALAAPLEPAAR